jgi:hypothetical protein
MAEGCQRYNDHNVPNDLNDLNEQRMANYPKKEDEYAGGTDFSLFGK